MTIPTPIILHHGFMDVLNLRVGQRGVYSFMGIDRLLKSRRQIAIRTRVHPSASIERRAGQLKEQITEILSTPPPGTRALIVAHSMGGLDARYMISRLGMESRIAALLTVSTPHRGTAYADYALRNMQLLRLPLVLKKLHLNLDAVPDLTTEGCARFNEQTPDHPLVRYFSVSAQCAAGDLPPWSRRAHRIIAESEGPNDGLVSVRSATYAEHLGTWPMDHWTLLNKQISRAASSAVAQRYSRCIEQVLEKIGADH